MAIIQKFMSLTPDQRNAFSTVKSAEALENFAKECNISLTAEETSRIFEYIRSNKITLTDEELKLVSGGWFTQRPSCKKKHCPHWTKDDVCNAPKFATCVN